MRALPKACISTWSPSMRTRPERSLSGRPGPLPTGWSACGAFRSRMLDVLIDAGSVDAADVQRAAEKLARFYAACTALDVTAAWVMARFRSEHEEDLRLLSDIRFALEAERTRHVLGMMATSLDRVLRASRRGPQPGHMSKAMGTSARSMYALLPSPNSSTAWNSIVTSGFLDPFDEISYLGLECERLGAGWIGTVFLSPARRSWGGPCRSRFSASTAAQGPCSGRASPSLI